MGDQRCRARGSGCGVLGGRSEVRVAARFINRRGCCVLGTELRRGGQGERLFQLAAVGELGLLLLEAAFGAPVDDMVPPAVARLVRKLMAKSPDDRYQTADEFAADLDRIAAGGGVSDRTADAATAIIAAPAAMPTTIARAPTQVRTTPYEAPVYYDYEERDRRRRPVWPWLLPIPSWRRRIAIRFTCCRRCRQRK